METVKANLKKNWNVFSKSLENSLINDGRTLNNYLENAIIVYKKYNQGSLAFTETKLKHVGYNFPFAILESIDSAS